MEIWVKDCFGKEMIGTSREELYDDLRHTSTQNYLTEVLVWFDGDHSESLIMLTVEGDEVWTVIN